MLEQTIELLKKRKSEDGQSNNWEKVDKKTSHGRQTEVQMTKVWAIRRPLKPGVNSDLLKGHVFHAALVTHLVILAI